MDIDIDDGGDEIQQEHSDDWILDLLCTDIEEEKEEIRIHKQILEQITLAVKYLQAISERKMDMPEEQKVQFMDAITSWKNWLLEHPDELLRKDMHHDPDSLSLPELIAINYMNLYHKIRNYPEVDEKDDPKKRLMDKLQAESFGQSLRDGTIFDQNTLIDLCKLTQKYIKTKERPLASLLLRYWYWVLFLRYIVKEDTDHRKVIYCDDQPDDFMLYEYLMERLCKTQHSSSFMSSARDLIIRNYFPLASQWIYFIAQAHSFDVSTDAIANDQIDQTLYKKVVKQAMIRPWNEESWSETTPEAKQMWALAMFDVVVRQYSGGALQFLKEYVIPWGYWGSHISIGLWKVKERHDRPRRPIIMQMGYDFWVLQTIHEKRIYRDVYAALTAWTKTIIRDYNGELENGTTGFAEWAEKTLFKSKQTKPASSSKPPSVPPSPRPPT